MALIMGRSFFQGPLSWPCHDGNNLCVGEAEGSNEGLWNGMVVRRGMLVC